MDYVYLMRAGEDHYKVGIARDIKNRLGSLKSSNPLPVYVVTYAPHKDARLVERHLHMELAAHVTNGGREWFKLSYEQALSLAIRIHNFSPRLMNEVINQTSRALNLDDLQDRAIAVFMEAGKASTSLLQRKLGVGYGRASRIMDALERKGVVSASDGVHARVFLGI